MNKTTRGFVLGLVCSLLVDAAIAQPASGTDAVPTPPADASTASGDAWISTRIKAALVPLVRERRAQIAVEVSQGRVVLAGTVEGELTRQQIIALCMQTRGVATVDASALKITGFAMPR